MASNTRAVWRATSAVTTTMAQGVSAMMRRVASTPSITGMIRSISTTSGRSRAHCATACSPSLATHATSRPGSSAIARRMVSTAICRSLTIPILT
ncbi:hypothetical protein G6F40_017248 [Rhizopus arrhizus]|nr:hypothetical protein G6F40_017248 [Rhizopus arrhizus]KAG1226102.1 hypothetical protein G6F68_019803 [Rhizopus microsporus]